MDRNNENCGADVKFERWKFGGGISRALLLLLFICSTGSAQELEIIGQLAVNINASNDPADERSNIDNTVGYIPTLSFYPQYEWANGFDFEIAYNSQSQFDGLIGTGDKGSNINGDLHRLWGRYSSDRIEFRYGLQKIAFGPGLILRPLMWFDTINQKDPTSQTEAVTAVRLRYFSKYDITYWGWVIHPEDADLRASGGRVEFPIRKLGNFGLSYHHRPKYTGMVVPDNSGLPLVFPTSAEDRYGIDFRADKVIGFWAEATVAKSSKDEFIKQFDRDMFMIGGDYTIPLGNGVYMLTEFMVNKIKPKAKPNDEQNEISAFLINYPISMLDSGSLIIEYDWEHKRYFNFLRLSRTYDNYIFNLLLFSNPERSDFIKEEIEFAGLTGFGKGMQLMVIFNH